ncbi:P-loop containing nucleoside triphosphate hydrolase protein [Baffinella frigidus]|nr:P-loop containing nucleoside triphosphate hydrolase protein [Cryptophyta sp. CCMP2293]
MGILRSIRRIAPLRALLLAIFVPWTAGNAGLVSVTGLLGKMAEQQLEIPASRAVSVAFGGSCRAPGHQRLARGGKAGGARSRRAPGLHLRGGALDAEEEALLDNLSLEDNKKAMPKCNVVLVGHVDSGKSTISGHLLYIAGIVDQRTLDKFEREAKTLGRESWKFAWAMDTSDEERAKGKTHEVGTASFTTEKRRYVILDAPGHKAFVPEMIGGACQAEVAILVVSARTGEFEAGFDKGGQTREHTLLIKTLGVKHLVVAVNKMDECKWGHERFDEIKNKLSAFLKQSGFNPADVMFVPITGLIGENLKTPIDPAVCPWYEGGPTLLDVLDSREITSLVTVLANGSAHVCTSPFRAHRHYSLLDVLDSREITSLGADEPVRIPINEKYRDGEVYLMGKVEIGTVKVGDELVVLPSKKIISVAQVFEEEEDVPQAAAGVIVRLRIKGATEDEVKVGDVLTPVKEENGRGVATKRFLAKLNILEYRTILTTGFRCNLHIHAVNVEASFGKIHGVLDKKTGQPEAKVPRFVRPGQSAIIEIETDEAICVETFKSVPSLGRFVLRESGTTVAIGVVTELLTDPEP